MKKSRILILALVALLAASSVSCAMGPKNDTAENGAEDKNPAITLGAMSIELTEDLSYIDVKSSSNYKVYSNKNYRVDLERINHSSITPNEGYPFPSLQEFMKFNLGNLVMGSDAEVQFVTEDGITFVEADTDGNGQLDMLVAVFETEGAFWDIRFSSTTIDYATARAQYLAWAKTVTFAN